MLVQMTESTKNILLREINRLKEQVEMNECDLNDGEAMKLIAALAHEPMTKEQVASYLKLPIATINNYISKSCLPAGRTRAGKEGKFWFRDEINDYLISY